MCPQPYNKPLVEDCNDIVCGSYNTGDWGSCSVPCGTGTKTRTVTCEGGPCIEEEPSSQENCNDFLCDNWVYSDWTECSKPCNTGTRTKVSLCPENGICDPEFKQDDITEDCNTTSCNWIKGDWYVPLEETKWSIRRLSPDRSITKTEDDPEHKSIFTFDVEYNDDGSYVMRSVASNQTSEKTYLILTVVPNGDGTSEVSGIFDAYWWKENQNLAKRTFNTTLLSPNGIIGDNFGIETNLWPINMIQVQ